MDELQKHYAKSKKLDTQDHILCDSIDMKFLEKANYRDVKQMGCCLGWKWEQGLTTSSKMEVLREHDCSQTRLW